MDCHLIRAATTQEVSPGKGMSMKPCARKPIMPNLPSRDIASQYGVTDRQIRRYGVAKFANLKPDARSVIVSMMKRKERQR